MNQDCILFLDNYVGISFYGANTKRVLKNNEQKSLTSKYDECDETGHNEVKYGLEMFSPAILTKYTLYENRRDRHPHISTP